MDPRPARPDLKSRIARAVVLALAIVVALALFIAGCFAAPIPMTYVKHDLPKSSAPANARCLFVLLPGLGDDAKDFEKKGIVDTIRRSGLSADIIATNATFGYYTKGKMPAQLWTDVIGPARAAREYEQTWLIGMSMGGFGTLLSAQDHATEFDGLIALAPYLGGDKVLDSIRKAGGLSQWTPPPEAPRTEDNYDWQLWRWLKLATSGQVKAPEMYVGWGKEDKLREGDALLGAALPKERVYSTEGGHDWGPWNALLARILREGTVGQTCKPQ